MAESALISITDVQAYREIDPKLNSGRFNSFVMQAQRTNLRNLLGAALYFDFFANITAPKYVALRDGESYTLNGETIQFYGIKPALIYWWLAIDTREGDLFQSAYGAIQLVNNPQQNFESAKEKERIAAGYMVTANQYANDIVQYLDAKSTTFPLWKSVEKRSGTEFITFRI